LNLALLQPGRPAVCLAFSALLQRASHMATFGVFRGGSRPAPIYPVNLAGEAKEVLLPSLHHLVAQKRYFPALSQFESEYPLWYPSVSAGRGDL
jgi:hypothetical protein